MKATPTITTEAIGETLGISKRAVLKQIRRLKEEGRVLRAGATKKGKWNVVE